MSGEPGPSLGMNGMAAGGGNICGSLGNVQHPGLPVRGLEGKDWKTRDGEVQGAGPSRRTQEWEPHAKGSVLHAVASVHEALKTRQTAGLSQLVPATLPHRPPQTRNKGTRA